MLLLSTTKMTRQGAKTIHRVVVGGVSGKKALDPSAVVGTILVLDSRPLTFHRNSQYRPERS
jgi:hypothetical protein